MNSSNLVTSQNLVPAGYAIALLLLLALTVSLVLLFIRSVGVDTPRVESHWGGLGGGLGGWEFSRSLAYLVAAVSFAILSITVLKGAADFYKPASPNAGSGNNANTGNTGNAGNTRNTGNSSNTGNTSNTGSAGNAQNTSQDPPKEGSSSGQANPRVPTASDQPKK